MLEMFTGVSFSDNDLFMMFLCPVFSMVGGVANFFALYQSHENAHKQGESGKLIDFKMASMHADRLRVRVILSVVIGLIVALYFIGSIVSPNTVAKVFALSIILGFSVPALWLSQEKLILDTTENRFKKISDNNDEISSNPHTEGADNHVKSSQKT